MIVARPYPPSDAPSTLARAGDPRAGLPALHHLLGVREGASSSQRRPGRAEAGLVSRPQRRDV